MKPLVIWLLLAVVVPVAGTFPQDADAQDGRPAPKMIWLSEEGVVHVRPPGRIQDAIGQYACGGELTKIVVHPGIYADVSFFVPGECHAWIVARAANTAILSQGDLPFIFKAGAGSSLALEGFVLWMGLARVTSDSAAVVAEAGATLVMENNHCWTRGACVLSDAQSTSIINNSFSSFGVAYDAPPERDTVGVMLRTPCAAQVGEVIPVVGRNNFLAINTGINATKACDPPVLSPRGDADSNRYDGVLARVILP